MVDPAMVALLALWAAPGDELPRKHTLFLNFDGAALTWAPGPDAENAALDTAFLARFEGTQLPAYSGDAAQVEAVTDAVRQYLAPFGIRVVAQRPPARVPYTMAMVGGTWTDINTNGPADGVAPEVDCLRENQRHVVFAFMSDESVLRQASTIAQEAAHAWGLDHTVGADRIMGYPPSDLLKTFGSECTDLCEAACQGAGTVYCTEEHEQFCPPGQQSDAEELTAVFGDGAPDDMPPRVEIVAPADGAALPSGAPVAVEVDVSDNFGGFGWELELRAADGALTVDVAFARQTTWELALPDGAYTIAVVAEDHADQVTRAEATIYVGVDPPLPGEGSSTTGGTETGDDSTGPPTADDDGGGDTGCGCRQADPRRGAGTSGWLLALLGLSAVPSWRGRSCRSGWRTRRPRTTPRASGRS